jgi:hypothetical protein
MKDKQLDILLQDEGRAWRETERGELPDLAALLPAAMNRPAVDDAFSLEELPPPTRRRWPVVVSVAAAVVVIAIASVAIAISHPSHRSAARPSVASSTSAHPAPIQDPKAVAMRAATALFDQLVLPAGAVSLPAAPNSSLSGPFSSFGGDRVIDVTRWWRLPLPPAAAATFFQTHESSGIRFSGTGTGGIAGKPPTVYSVIFNGTQASTAYSQLTLQVKIVADGLGSAIEVEAEAVWVPVRAASEFIPTSVTSVDFTFTPGASRASPASVVRRTITGPEALRLVELVNALPIANDAPSTGLGHPDLIVLVFHTRTGGPITVATSPGGLGWTYAIGGAYLPPLDNTAALYAETNQLAGSH